MKRILLSVAGGMIGPAFVVAVLMVAEQIDVHFLERHRLKAQAWFFLVLWPIFILPEFPASDSPDPNAPTERLLLSLAVILLNVLAYAVLTFGLLHWRGKRLSRTKPNR